MSKQPWWSMLLVLVVIVVCATVLQATGSGQIDWLRDIAFALIGGAAGNALPGGSGG